MYTYMYMCMYMWANMCMHVQHQCSVLTEDAQTVVDGHIDDVLGSEEVALVDEVGAASEASAVNPDEHRKWLSAFAL